MKTFNSKNDKIKTEYTQSELSLKKILVITFIIVLLTLIPAYLIAVYAHPSVDDYFYTDETHKVWEDTGSLAKVISTSFEEMQMTYNEWQGNFSAIFLMRLAPSLFSEKYYFLTPIILITCFCLCTAFFIYTVARKIFGSGKISSLLFALGFTLMIFELTDVPSDSFYWFNGSIYYTFFFSLFLLTFGLLIRVCCLNYKKKLPACCLMTIISGVLAFFIGGSNFPTALIMVLLLVLFSVFGISFYFIKKQKPYSLIPVIALAFVTICALAGFFISVKAPGNAIRQASVGGSSSLVKTFIFTFAFGGYSVAHVLSAPAIVTYICLLPLIYHLAICGHKKGFNYPVPLVVLLFSWGIYCSMGTPVFYAQGLKIAYRITNIIYFAAHLLIAFNLIYFCGYIERRYGSLELAIRLKEIFIRASHSAKQSIAIFAVMLFAVMVACIGHIEVSQSESGNSASFTGMPLSVSAAFSLLNGDASKYDAELDAREAYLSAKALEYLSEGTPFEARNAEVPPLTVTPSPIFHTDITDDAGYWKNAHLAKFYNFNTVITK